MKYFGVYLITSLSSDSVYVGKETTEGKRFRVEVRRALKGDTRQPYLFNWIRKYYPDVSVKTIQVCSSKEELNAAETFWIAHYRNTLGPEKVLNIQDGGDGGAIGEWTIERRQRQSESQKIAQNRPDVKRKKSLSLKKIQKEVQNRPEVRAKKSRPRSPEFRERMKVVARLREERKRNAVSQ